MPDPGQMERWPAAGPLRRSLWLRRRRDGRRETWELGSERWVSLQSANPLIMLRRVVWGGGDDEAAKALGVLLRWAAGGNGQPEGLLRAATARRRAALRDLEAQGLVCRTLRARPRWRLVVGLGASATAHETSLALHGTYGLPVLPGTALKGTAARSCADTARREVLFGGPRPDTRRAGRAAGRRGTVVFLDALPTGPVPLVHDVMTPHVGRYYSEGKPPAEYWEPVPVDFLAVGGGEFLVHLVGRDAGDVDQAAALVAEALDDQGIGAKTSGGYGYLTVEPEPQPARGEGAG